MELHAAWANCSILGELQATTTSGCLHSVIDIPGKIPIVLDCGFNPSEDMIHMPDAEFEANFDSLCAELRPEHPHSSQPSFLACLQFASSLSNEELHRYIAGDRNVDPSPSTASRQKAATKVAIRASPLRRRAGPGSEPKQASSKRKRLDYLASKRRDANVSPTAPKPTATLGRRQKTRQPDSQPPSSAAADQRQQSTSTTNNPISQLPPPTATPTDPHRRSADVPPLPPTHPPAGADSTDQPPGRQQHDADDSSDEDGEGGELEVHEDDSKLDPQSKRV